MNKNYLILDNLGSMENVGAIFRTADAIGIDKIFLCGITPGPIDKFGRENKKVLKSAMGACDFVEYEFFDDILLLIDKLKEEDYQIISLEQDKRSLDFRKIKLSSRNAFIVGSEVFGVNDKVLNKSDQIAEIPMLGRKKSLNVATATGILLYGLLL